MNCKTLTPVAFLIALSFVACRQSPVSSQQNATDQQSLSPLISAAELSELQDAETAGLRVIEAGRYEKDFNAGHLPSAAFVHWVKDMTDPEHVAMYKNPDATNFAATMSRLGIKKDDRIVIYDRLANRLSTRLYWTLKYYGHEQVQVLDGGFNMWKAKFELSTDAEEAEASEYEIGSMNTEIHAAMEEVAEQLKDSETCLIDGRPGEQFSGEIAGKVFHTKKEHSRKGHIPGAVNVVWKENFNKDGTFKSVEELQALYKDAGVSPDHDVITYCNEGLHAAPPWFVLTRLLDYQNVRLYDNSMAEWSDSDHPLETVEKSKAN